ncbi:unnamed protein product [Phytomonas sp. Hart1]|nr:unnamed protein product [Phytomonas sp. Hart1]|eukprot:CCW66744.1 unnamed protein product [Phytomonas sp. isolate Hart1]
MIDHSLNEYYSACHLDSDSDVSSTTSPDDAGIGSWCATSVVVSPLRGRARMLGAQHCSGGVNIRHKQPSFQDKENNFERCCAGDNERAFSLTRGQTAKQIIRTLKQPFSPHLVSTTMVKKYNSAQRLPPVCLQEGNDHDMGKKSSALYRNEKDFRELLLFDVLCVLRLSACNFCVKETNLGESYSMGNSNTKHSAVWRLKPEVRDQLLSEKGRAMYLSSLQRLLGIADDVHALQAQLDAFYEQHQRISAEADSTYTLEAAFFSGKSNIGACTVHADRAIGFTSLNALLRLAELVSAWILEFKSWVFRLQEDLLGHFGSYEPMEPSMKCPEMVGLRASHFNTTVSETPCPVSPFVKDLLPKDEEKELLHLAPQQCSLEGVRKIHKTEETPTGTILRAHSVNTGYVFLDNLCLPQIVAAVEHNGILLQRCLMIINKSNCFNAFQTRLEDSGGVATDGGRSEKNNEEGTSGKPPRTEFAFLNQCTELGAALLDHLIIQLSALQHPSAMDLYRLYLSLLIHCSWPYVILSTSAMFGFVYGIDSQKWRQLLPRLFRSSFSHIRVGGAHRRYPTDVLSLILSCVDYQKSAVSLEPLKTLSMLSSARRFILHNFQTFAKEKRHHTMPKNHCERPNTYTGPAFSETNQNEEAMKICRTTNLNTRDVLHPQVDYSWHASKRENDGVDAVGLHLASFLEPRRALPLCFATISSNPVVGHSSFCVAKEDPGGNDDKASNHHRGSFWYLQVSDLETFPELRLTKRLSDLKTGPIDGQSGKGGGAEGGSDLDKSLLWMDKTMPAARWIAAALLIPIGVVVQQLQQRRAARLFRSLDPACLPSRSKGSQRLLDIFIQWPDEQDDHLLAGEVSFEDYLETGKPQSLNSAEIVGLRNSGVTFSPLPRSLVSFNLAHALDLLLDVALCRDKACILESFLERLYVEPRWWQRTSTCRNFSGGCGGSAKGTASTFISNLFTEALRGKPYGNLVELCILPKRKKIAAPEMVNSRGVSKIVDPCAEAYVEVDAEKGSCDKNLLGYEMLDVFESFQLIFHFPEELELILLPKKLSVRLGSEAGAVERTYATLFWGKRRGGVTDSPWDDKQLHHDPTTSSTIAGRGIGDVNDARSDDVWSSAFGYMCALHFTQITLREHRKLLHIRDTQDNQLLSILGRPIPFASSTPISGNRNHSEANSLQYVARSLGSSYYLLSFAVDTFLTFTQNEVAIAIYKLEHLFTKAETPNSTIQLCQELDTALVRVEYICFLAGHSTASLYNHSLQRGTDKARGIDTEVDVRHVLRAHIHTILSLALDPSRMPPKFLGTRSRNAIEALVALVSALQDFSLLKNRLRPLLVLLTFNNFFGSNNCTSFRFR